jgi:hypothetical protein
VPAVSVDDLREGKFAHECCYLPFRSQVWDADSGELLHQLRWVSCTMGLL